ncbi:MAG: amidohydrolase [Anaerovoracaceae bacterium]|jgi:predicted amidohydrolase YtcJ
MYDLILKNGNVITMNNHNERKKWIAVNNRKIAAVGSPEELCPDGKKVIDLDGATVLPGLFDSHCHVMNTGQALESVDLLNTASIDEVLSRISDRCQKAEPKEWIFGAGFSAPLTKEQRFPTAQELDAVSNNHPIVINTQTLHGCVLNSKAMELASLRDSSFPYPVEENGILSDDTTVFAALREITKILDDDTLLKYIARCADFASEQGVTTLGGLLGQFVDGDRDVDITMQHAGEFPIRIEIFYQTWDLKQILERDLPRVGGCLTLDGAGFEYTMANMDTYPQRPERRGFLLHTDQEIYDLISAAHQHDIQCAFHALGERAIDQLIFLYQQVILEQGRKDLRHRIEHFSLPSDKHIDMLCKLRLIASMQPAFSGIWGEPGSGPYVSLLGQEAADRMEIFPDIYNRGGVICGGSDSPVTSIDPLFGIACCVNNPDPRRNLPLEEAIAVFTRNAAYAVNLENRKGSIETGKDADFTIIDKDPYQICHTPEIFNMKVLQTIREGEIKYSRKESH